MPEFDSASYAYVLSNGVLYRTTEPQIPDTLGSSAVDAQMTGIPSMYVLYQNYPNPFNPSTMIRYAPLQRSHVTLTMFNPLGQHVASLGCEYEEAGYHDAKFDGSQLSSGIYFYRLLAGTIVETRRMVLAR
ncbi:MAG TPA: T9SS type A sorting domain-containing protein [Bacteroidota bacterium]|nr:T9SS type A sorting domain-containing protein [Bacteroidota bacterium]